MAYCLAPEISSSLQLVMIPVTWLQAQQTFQRGWWDVTCVQQHGHVINQAASAACCNMTWDPVSLSSPLALCVFTVSRGIALLLCDSFGQKSFNYPVETISILLYYIFQCSQKSFNAKLKAILRPIIFQCKGPSCCYATLLILSRFYVCAPSQSYYDVLTVCWPGSLPSASLCYIPYKLIQVDQFLRRYRTIQVLEAYHDRIFVIR